MAWHAEFWRSFGPSSELPSLAAPELALAGRSNVGKSSLLNALCQRRGLARTSGTPGRTQLVNYFAVSLHGSAALQAGRPDFYLVDLPGYGYAAVSETTRRAWGKLIDRYLAQRRAAARGFLLLHLVDARQRTALDRQLAEYVTATGIRALVVCTKTDKLKQGERARLLESVRRDLSLPPAVPVYATAATAAANELGPLRAACEHQLGLASAPPQAPSQEQ